MMDRAFEMVLAGPLEAGAILPVSHFFIAFCLRAT